MRSCFNILVILLALGKALAAPNNSELKIGVSQEFETLNPIIAQQAASSYIRFFSQHTLVHMGPASTWDPLMVKKVPSFANKLAKIEKNKAVVVFEIKENVKWGDGVPVTCADFAFTREVALHPNVSVPSRDDYGKVEKIEWDEKTPKKCTFIFGKPRWDFHQIGTFFVVPKHLEEPIFKKHSQTPLAYEKNTLFTTNPTNPGLYSGPYLVNEVKLGSHVTLVPNPLYYGNKPKIQKIVIKLIPNTATMEANLISGAIDMIAIIGITFDQALKLEEKVAKESLPFKVLYEPSMLYEHIDFNLDVPMFQDVRVRRALLMAIDRQEMSQALFKGRQPAALHDVPPADKEWYTEDKSKITIYPSKRSEALAQAVKLLDEAGWKVGSGGIREKDGKKLSFPFMTTAGNKVRENVQVFLQNQWKTIGAEAVIRNEPARVFFGETVRKRKFEGLLMYAWANFPQVIPDIVFLSSNIASEANGFAGQNVPGWRNPDTDAAIQQLMVEMDPNKRRNLRIRIVKNYTEDVPAIPLYFRSDIAVIPKNLKNFEITGHQFYDSYQAEHWDLQ